MIYMLIIYCYILYRYICKFLRRFKVEIYFNQFKNVIKNQFILNN